ncbi:MAG: ribonuclease H-like domain-containing protein [Bryobacterales bacterium]|nr:ribonuclease H-like domain-containing protein [Bryobacteraceae bacterium]MDW8129698.1 ribonuclease H-like domain-containing protein [Bryobacterales bacterium]
MGEDIQDLLAVLKRKIERINRKYAADASPTRRSEPERCAPSCIERWLPGQLIETPRGRHFETERLWERHRRHGCIEIEALAALPADLLDRLSEGEIPCCPPERWAFLDTETTGLAGGTGTYAFLVGVGRVTPEGFRIRQFFMRDHREEPSLLWALEAHLRQFDVLVTYNGKVYDQPLLETRYRLARAPSPFERIRHLDLLYGARRLWKLRLESCRLVDLEAQILGFEREGDIPGEMIPCLYFEYLRTREALRIVPVFRHNALDILTLACLTGIVPFAYRSPEQVAFAHGSDYLGLARWLLKAGETDRALALLRRAVEQGLPDDLLFRSLWEMACLEKRRGNAAGAVALFQELAGCRNRYRAAALTELAKHCEHAERDYARALDYTGQALAIEPTPELERRRERLKRKLAAAAAAPRLL